jgi:hypothetical protein
VYLGGVQKLAPYVFLLGVLMAFGSLLVFAYRVVDLQERLEACQSGG